MGAYLLVLSFFSADGSLSTATTYLETSAACTAAGDAFVDNTTTGVYSCTATGVTTSYKLMVTLGGVAVSMGSFKSSTTCANAGINWKAQMGNSKQYTYVCAQE